MLGQLNNSCFVKWLEREEDDESSDSDERIIEIDPVILKHSLEEISYPNTINNEVNI